MSVYIVLKKNKCLENPYANNDDYKTLANVGDDDYTETLANVKKTTMLMITERR